MGSSMKIQHRDFLVVYRAVMDPLRTSVFDFSDLDDIAVWSEGGRVTGVGNLFLYVGDRANLDAQSWRCYPRTPFRAIQNFWTLVGSSGNSTLPSPISQHQTGWCYPRKPLRKNGYFSIMYLHLAFTITDHNTVITTKHKVMDKILKYQNTGIFRPRAP